MAGIKKSSSELGRITPDEYAAGERSKVVLVVDSVRSLHNVGSFFRTADAFDIEAVWLCGVTATPPNRDIHKTALGAELNVEWRYFDKCTDALAELRSKGYGLYCVEQTFGSVMLGDFEVDPDGRYALVVGNEVDGVSQEAVDMCDGAIEIPQSGVKHSLNVSVAAAVVLWHFYERMHLR